MDKYVVWFQMALQSKVWLNIFSWSSTLNPLSMILRKVDVTTGSGVCMCLEQVFFCYQKTRETCCTYFSLVDFCWKDILWFLDDFLARQNGWRLWLGNENSGFWEWRWIILYCITNHLDLKKMEPSHILGHGIWHVWYKFRKRILFFCKTEKLEIFNLMINIFLSYRKEKSCQCTYL